MFNLAVRQETPERYDANKVINALIEKTFKASLERFLTTHSSVIPYIPEKDTKRIWNSPEFQDTAYGVTTLGMSGCAVYCFHQGLRLQHHEKLSISDLASEIAKKGYYEPGKGTYHNLYDHYGLRRACDIQEILDIFQCKANAVVTVLLRNDAYLETDAMSGRHFVNIVGCSCSGLYVDDPNISYRKLIPFEELLPAIDIAWVW